MNMKKLPVDVLIAKRRILMLCAAMVAFAAMTACKSGADLVTIKGHVVDSVLQEDYPFMYIDVIQGDSVIAKTYTDFDGNFVMGLPAGEYVLKFSAVGCYRQTIAIIADKNTDMGTIKMVVSDPFFYDDPHIDNHPPVIEIDPNGATQQMEIEGVNVIAR